MSLPHIDEILAQFYAAAAKMATSTSAATQEPQRKEPTPHPGSTACMPEGSPARGEPGDSSTAHRVVIDEFQIHVSAAGECSVSLDTSVDGVHWRQGNMHTLRLGEFAHWGWPAEPYVRLLIINQGGKVETRNLRAPLGAPPVPAPPPREHVFDRYVLHVTPRIRGRAAMVRVCVACGQCEGDTVACIPVKDPASVRRNLESYVEMLVEDRATMALRIKRPAHERSAVNDVSGRGAMVGGLWNVWRGRR